MMMQRSVVVVMVDVPGEPSHHDSEETVLFLAEEERRRLQWPCGAVVRVDRFLLTTMATCSGETVPALVGSCSTTNTVSYLLALQVGLRKEDTPARINVEFVAETLHRLPPVTRIFLTPLLMPFHKGEDGQIPPPPPPPLPLLGESWSETTRRALSALMVRRSVACGSWLALQWWGSVYVYEVKRIEGVNVSIGRTVPTTECVWKALEAFVPCEGRPLRFGFGGYSNQVRQAMDLAHRALGNTTETAPSRALLLRGIPGTGKSYLAREVAATLGVPCHVLHCPDAFRARLGESEQRVKDLFTRASHDRRAVVVLDEIDVLCSRHAVPGSVESRLAALLFSLLDQLAESQGVFASGRVFVVATSNRPAALDPALLRRRRIDQVIELGVPDANDRREILQIIAARILPPSGLVLTHMVHITMGFVAADLVALVQRAATLALRQQTELPKRESTFVLTIPIVDAARSDVRAAALADRPEPPPSSTLDALHGLDEAVRKLRAAILLPLSSPSSFRTYGVAPPTGVLLYGPPGTGKTALARAVAGEARAHFLSVQGPEIVSKVVGDAERALAHLFAQARTAAPCIVFLDQLEAVAPRRGHDSLLFTRLLATFVTELDALAPTRHHPSPVLVIAATSRPELVDPALLRPGRLDVHVFVPPPNSQARVAILRSLVRAMPVTVEDWAWLADRTDGYSAADLESLCREAAMATLRDDIHATRIEPRHFEHALRVVSPSLLHVPAVPVCFSRHGFASLH